MCGQTSEGLVDGVLLGTPDIQPLNAISAVETIDHYELFNSHLVTSTQRRRLSVNLSS